MTGRERCEEIIRIIDEALTDPSLTSPSTWQLQAEPEEGPDDSA